MNIDNITSDSMVLTNDGKAVLIKVYEEEIERLNNRIAELEKGVSRKEEQITNLDDENFDLENEIERLNNIIYNLEDKLNKLIEEQLEQYNKRVENWEEKRNVSNTWLTSRDCYYSVLKYLQELKGSGKE